MTQPKQQSNPAKSDDALPEDEVQGTFNPNDYDWPKHLKIAIDALPAKRLLIDRRWKYYDGEHPRVWLTEAIKEQLDDALVLNLAENWCDLAVDAPIKRLVVEGFTAVTTADKPGGDPIHNDAATNVWKDNKMRLAQKDVYKDAGVAGESFIFAWKDEDKEYGVDWTVKDARNVWWPDDCHRSEPSRVVLIWADEEEGVWRATMYYKYVVVRLVGPKLKSGAAQMESIPQARWWDVDPINPGGEHGYERVPVVRFSLESRVVSVIDKIRSTQDKINKLAANMMVNAEFNAWRKMAILSEQKIDDDDLKARPNRIWHLDPGGGQNGGAPTTIWEGSETSLANYADEQDRLINKLFTKAHLPGHLKIGKDSAVPSGAAYEADEGPFTEYIEDLQESYGESWHDLYELCLDVDVEAQWRDPHIKADAAMSTTVKTLVDAGVPILLALKYYASWTDKQIKEFNDAPLSPKEQLSQAAAQALANGGGMANGGTPDDGTGADSNQQDGPVGGKPPATGSAMLQGVGKR